MSHQLNSSSVATSTRCAVQGTDPLSSHAGAFSAGPSHCDKDKRTDFEVEWARLPSAITALPSSCKIKELVMRNAVGKSSFKQSLPVETNGIDRCFASRPSFRHVISDLANHPTGNPMLQLPEDPSSSPHSAHPLTFAEAMWEGHFGVPRHLTWYSAAASSPDGVDSCSPRRFQPSDPTRLGLTIDCTEYGPDFVDCALAATRRPPILLTPPAGLLYTVVQGSLLLVSWPYTEHNFEAWWQASRTKGQKLGWDLMDKLEEPKINLLRTGDTAYLPAGTIDVMMAFSHVAVTNRTILNPAPAELQSTIQICHRLVESFIDHQENTAFSPCDFRTAQGINKMFSFWTKLAMTWILDREGSGNWPAGTYRQDMRMFCRGMERVWVQLEVYFMLAKDAGHVAYPQPREVLNLLPPHPPRRWAQANVLGMQPGTGNALDALCRLLQPLFSI